MDVHPTKNGIYRYWAIPISVLFETSKSDGEKVSASATWRTQPLENPVVTYPISWPYVWWPTPEFWWVKHRFFLAQSTFFQVRWSCLNHLESTFSCFIAWFFFVSVTIFTSLVRLLFSNSPRGVASNARCGWSIPKASRILAPWGHIMGFHHGITRW